VEKLNADERKIITEAALEATDFERKLSRSAKRKSSRICPPRAAWRVNEISKRNASASGKFCNRSLTSIPRIMTRHCS
jgi:TRAP-type C4-dicarboxylate transport system substrate-binding protein